jgi:hypothetical protein
MEVLRAEVASLLRSRGALLDGFGLAYCLWAMARLGLQGQQQLVAEMVSLRCLLAVGAGIRVLRAAHRYHTCVIITACASGPAARRRWQRYVLQMPSLDNMRPKSINQVAAVEPWVAGLTPRILSQLLWALVELRASAPQELLQAALRQGARGMARAGLRDCAQLVWAAARLKVAPNEAWWDAFFQRTSKVSAAWAGSCGAAVALSRAQPVGTQPIEVDFESSLCHSFGATVHTSCTSGLTCEPGNFLARVLVS